MPKRHARWTRVRSLTPEGKADIAVKCEAFIAETLKPRFLPEIVPSEFNYPVDILGKWRGGKYSFISRYRSGFPENRGEEFNEAFARLDHVEEVLSERRFDVMWHRHTGQWFRLYGELSLDEALRAIETDGILHPV